jgi:hypothetical protein
MQVGSSDKKSDGLEFTKSQQLCTTASPIFWSAQIISWELCQLSIDHKAAPTLTHKFRLSTAVLYGAAQQRICANFVTSDQLQNMLDPTPPLFQQPFRGGDDTHDSPMPRHLYKTPSIKENQILSPLAPVDRS